MKHLVAVFLLLAVFYFFPYSYLDIAKTSDPLITVAVQGAVEEDTILEVENYSTVDDILKLVELSDDADLSSLNRLAVLKDGDVLVIPSIYKNNKVSINTGTLEELMTLENIGEKKALKIIEYRETYGLFQSLEDLMNVPGIKEKTFEKIKDNICL